MSKYNNLYKIQLEIILGNAPNPITRKGS